MKAQTAGPGRSRKRFALVAAGLALAAFAVVSFYPRPIQPGQAPETKELAAVPAPAAPGAVPSPLTPKPPAAPKQVARPQPRVPAPAAPEAAAAVVPPPAVAAAAPRANTPAPAAGPAVLAQGRLERTAAGQVLRVKGQIDDPVATGAGIIHSIFWRVAGAALEGALAVREDRSFEFELPARELPERTALGLRVETSDGRMSELSISLLIDRRAPRLVLLEPTGEEAWYGRRIVVRGRLGDPADELDRVSDLAPLAWQVADPPLKGEVAPAADGSFSFEIPTAGMTERLVVVLRAEDLAGNASQRELIFRNDLEGPLIEFVSPLQRGYYGRELTVTGRVSDAGRKAEMAEAVKSFSYSLLGVPGAAGDLAFDGTGRFKLKLPAEKLSGLQALLFQAEDWNGNSSRAVLFLRPAPDRNAADAAALAPLPDACAIEIGEPEAESGYRSRVKVGGRISTPTGATLSWRVAGTDLNGAGGLHRDGSFEFECPTAGLRGPQLVVLRATDGQGRTSEQGLVLFERMDGPLLTVSAPGDNEFFSSKLSVQGSVVNSTEEPDTASEVARFIWELDLTPPLRRELSFDFDGAFAFDLPTSGWKGTRTLTLTAEDRNGHTSRLALRLLDPNLKPVLAVSRPRPDSAYGARIQVTGRLEAPYADIGRSAALSSLVAEVRRGEGARSAPLYHRELEPGPDGSFSDVIEAGQFQGPVLLSLSAETTEGEVVETIVRLVQGAGGIPSFAAQSGDGRVELSWEAVPGTAAYRVHFGEGEGPPNGSAAPRETAAARIVVNGLENGRRYNFRLQAAGAPGVPDVWSAPLPAVPLSAETLKPVASGEYRRVRLRWNRIAGANEFEVWRAADGKGEFVKAAGPIAGLEYVDEDVRFGTSYAYRIRPALAGTPLSGPAVATSAAFSDKRFEALGTLPLGGVKAVALSGHYAVVAAGAEGLIVVDVSRPDRPVAVGQVATSDARDVAVRGRLAFLADGAGGLKVVSLENPARPYVLGVRPSVDACAVAVRNDRVYLADGDGGFKIIDVSVPRRPVRLSGLEIPGARAVALVGNLAVVAAGVRGAFVIDIADAEKPGRLAVLDMDARGVTTDRNRVYLAAGRPGFQIIGLADPTHPVVLASLAAGEAETIRALGNFALVAGPAGDLKLYDLFDPARPVELDRLRIDGLQAMAVLDDTVCLADASGLRLARLLLRGESIEIAALEAGGKATRVSLSGDYAFTANHENGLAVSRLKAEPAAGPALAGQAATEFAEQVWISAGRAYVADGEAGLKVVDISTLGSAAPAPGFPTVGAIRTGGHAYAVAGLDERVWLAAGPAGLVEVNVAAAPVLSGRAALDDARDLVRRGSHLFVADAVRGLVVFDCSQAGSPRQIANLPAPGARRLALQDGRLVMAGAEGCLIVDVSNPAKPVRLGEYATVFAEGVALDGRYLLIAEGHRGLRVVDLSVPARPVEVSACDGIYAVDVATRAGLAYVADARGLKIVRILVPDWLVR